jgi:hypothetical protein
MTVLNLEMGQNNLLIPRSQSFHISQFPVRVFDILTMLSLTEHHALEADWESGDIAPRSLDLDTRWRWVVSFTPLPFYRQGKSLWYPLGRRLCGPQIRSGRGGEEIISHPLSGLELPIIQPVAPDLGTKIKKMRKHGNNWELSAWWMIHNSTK